MAFPLHTSFYGGGNSHRKTRLTPLPFRVQELLALCEMQVEVIEGAMDYWQIQDKRKIILAMFPVDRLDTYEKWQFLLGMLVPSYERDTA